MNTRCAFFKRRTEQCLASTKQLAEQLQPYAEQYVLYPICWVGAMSQNCGLTAFGLLKFFHFYFGNDKDLADPDVLFTAMYFMSCTFGIIYRTRMPGLRENILKEQYNHKEKKKIGVSSVFKDLIVYVGKCGDNDETYRERIGDAVTLTLQLLSIFSGGINFFNMLLNTSTLYNNYVFPGFKNVYRLITNEHLHPSTTDEAIYSVSTAFTANMVYFNFNIGSALEGSEKVGRWIKGKLPLYTNDDEFWVFIKALSLIVLQGLSSPFFAYLSGHNALKQLPFGIGHHVSDSFNDKFSIISAALFVITRSCSTGSSIFKFWHDRAHPGKIDPSKPVPSKWDKRITYFLGAGDCVGTLIGNAVGYFFLIHEFFGNGVVHDKEHPFTFKHFRDEFSTWPGHVIAAFLVGLLNGGINWMFSVKNGLERAVEIEDRLKPEYRPWFFRCRRNKELKHGGGTTIQEHKIDVDPVVTSRTRPRDVSYPSLYGNGINHDHKDDLKKPLLKFDSQDNGSLEEEEVRKPISPSKLYDYESEEEVTGAYDPPKNTRLTNGDTSRTIFN